MGTFGIRLVAKAAGLRFSLLAIAFVWSQQAQAQDRLTGIALVIGQSGYEHLSPLPNPANDADAIEELLSGLGFDTTLVSDRNARQLTRALDGFVEDAADADVAILYYAGHGIEAGGENYLIPVDADMSALDAAGERLVPISAWLDRLKATVPVTIVMLDACRDNPFPADALVRASPEAEPVPMGEAGLAETRGATRLSAVPTPQETYGTVIAFAAEPGRAALDGVPGANSPYTAAVLRHLDAMAGQEFGTVMRMVAEEVYLKTGGRQQPWVNESLRRLLYFGETPQPTAGPEGEILRERRGLLLTIAALPSAQRDTAERLAGSGNVPMDVVFAMMRAAGIDPSADPAEVETRLRAEIERFAQNRLARDTLNDPDPEIERLTRLADEAELEGALNAADALREQAKARVVQMRSTREDQIETLRQRIREDAAVYARSAETKQLLFQYAAVAADYGAAYDLAVDWDRDLAYDMRIQQLEAVKSAAFSRGDRATLLKGLEIARAELEAPRVVWTAHQKARLTKMLGQLLFISSRFDDNPDALDETVALFRSILSNPDAVDETRSGGLWDIWNDLGSTLHLRGSQTGDATSFQEAADAFREAGKQLDPDDAFSTALAAVRKAHETGDEEARQRGMAMLEAILKVDNPYAFIGNWASVQHNLGTVLRALSLEADDPAALREEALLAYDNALRARKTIDNKSDAALTLKNLGNLHIDRANDGIEGARADAIDAYEQAIGMLDPSSEPLPYADGVVKLVDAILGDERDNSAARHDRALEVLNRAVASLDPDAAGADIAEIHNNIGRVQYEKGVVGRDADAYSAAIVAFSRAAELWQGRPREVAIATRNIAQSLYERSLLDGNLEALRQAEASYRAARAYWTRDTDPAEFARTSFDAGRTLHEIAAATGDAADYEAAIAAYQDALSVWTGPDANENWSWAHRNIAAADFALGTSTGDIARFSASAEHYKQAADGFAASGLMEHAADAALEQGRAWHEVGVAGPDEQALRKALDAYLAAGKAYAGLPAMVENLGYALSNAGIVHTNLAALADAEAHFRTAIELFTASIDIPAQDEAEIVARRGRLAHASLALAEETGDAADFAHAIASTAAVTAALSRTDAPADWANAENTRAYTLLKAGQAGNDPALLERAVGAARDATSVHRDIAALPELGYSEDTLCSALVALGELRGNAATVAEGVEACRRAVTVLSSADLPQILEIAQQNLARGETALRLIRTP